MEAFLLVCWAQSSYWLTDLQIQFHASRHCRVYVMWRIFKGSTFSDWLLVCLFSMWPRPWWSWINGEIITVQLCTHIYCSWIYFSVVLCFATITPLLLMCVGGSSVFLSLYAVDACVHFCAAVWGCDSRIIPKTDGLWWSDRIPFAQWLILYVCAVNASHFEEIKIIFCHLVIIAWTMKTKITENKYWELPEYCVTRCVQRHNAASRALQTLCRPAVWLPPFILDKVEHTCRCQAVLIFSLLEWQERSLEFLVFRPYSRFKSVLF